MATSLCVGAAVVLSLAPSLLPRSATVQAVATGLLAALGWAVAAAWRHRPWRGAGDDGRGRLPAAAVGTAASAAALIGADRWQGALRAAMDRPAIGPGYWLEVCSGAGALTLATALTAAAAAAVCRRLGRLRVAAVALTLTLATVTWLVPAAAGALDRSFTAANAAVDDALLQPVSTALSGSADSLSGWQTLGANGRKFVAGRAAPGAVRAYVGLDAAAGLDARVALAVRELERAGGLRRAAVVVAVPTGSGWIDGGAVAGFERRFGGDVATVGVQYSKAPSALTFLFGRRDAELSARALFDAVSARIGQLPVGDRPKLYVYGQSLGAVGASAIFRDGDDLRARSCGALYAGPPAGAVNTDGAVVLANASDPVVSWSPALLVRPPDLPRVRADAPVPPWLPVAGFVATTVDLLTALDAAPGHGHRYGADQGTALPDCAAPPTGGTLTAPASRG
ncbi:alpha/beta-hydrolase family protein [Rhodococcus kronopolitis]|uniref:Alpha/beta-hydrolase family protein n=1 Tax=Rhodococcus kronopolitis TaxID=1460226 RepID=A0ABV9FJZ7_9NOCA